MAREIHVCKGCGHETTVFGTNRAEAARKLKWWNEKRPLCLDCEGKKEYAAATAKAAELELPDLVGTQLQVELAQRTRVPLLANLMRATEASYEPANADWINDESARARMIADIEVQREKKEAVLSYLGTILDAGWWIDRRSYDDDRVIQMAIAEMEKVQKPSNDPVLIEAVDLEMMVRPETPVSETIGRFFVSKEGTSVWIIYDEKRDDFREAVKLFGARWDGTDKRWIVQTRTEECLSTAVEVAQHLIASGFVLKIKDNAVRDLVKAGTVEKTDGRRIDYAGSNFFSIKWRRIDGDYYEAARKISGSKWSREHQCVLVPITAADDLREFATTYGFPLITASR